MATDVIVETGSGKLRGLTDGGVCVFRGIPFARPPVGTGRFRPPLPPIPWAGVRDATQVGAAAPQNPDPFASLLHPDHEVCSEDCLTLNVWTPRCGDKRRPVMVFVHGGAFLHGSARWPAFDGGPLAGRGDVVVVTIQYRLGALGFAYLTPFATAGDVWPANLGLLDQIAALEWVRNEIAAFGGDPTNVTVFGHSAGAISVGVLLGAPRARGLFHRAILQSGPPVAIQPSLAAGVGDSLLRALDLDRTTLKRLREVGVEHLLASESACRQSPGVRPLDLPFLPVLDGELLASHPMDAVGEGNAAGVSLLIGTTRDEMTAFLVMDPQLHDLEEAALVQHCQRVIPTADAAALVRAYREIRGDHGLPCDPPRLWVAIMTDRYVRYPSMRLAELQRRHQADVYAYLFTWPSPFMGGVLGACHGLDLPFVFKTFDAPMVRTFTGDGSAVAGLAEQMQEAWLAFARTGNPSHGGIGEWPAYDRERRTTMLLGSDCAIEHAPGEDERRLWDVITLAY